MMAAGKILLHILPGDGLDESVGKRSIKSSPPATLADADAMASQIEGAIRRFFGLTQEDMTSWWTPTTTPWRRSARCCGAGRRPCATTSWARPSTLRLNVVARRDANQAGQRQQRHGHCSPPRQQQHHHGQQAQPQRDDEDRQE